jgi:hypothetical protein
MGYPDGTKGLKLYNLEAKKFIRSRSVLFCENKFNDFDSKLKEKDYISFFSPLETSETQRSEESSSDDVMMAMSMKTQVIQTTMTH